jgi:hypothetical protein
LEVAAVGEKKRLEALGVDEGIGPRVVLRTPRPAAAAAPRDMVEPWSVYL